MDTSSRNIRPSVQQNEISSKKNHLVSALKSIEATIKDKKKKYFDKVNSLVIAWDQLAVYVSVPSSESPITEVESLFSHTLRFVLRADWPKASAAIQTHLTVTLQRFISILSNSKKYPYVLQQCRVLESVVKNPWSHPTLSRIFVGEEVEINDLLDYFMYENGRVIVVRLEMMLEAQCEDIALRLSKSCLLTYNNSHPLELDYSQDELDYITDIYFCSLYRDKKKKELTNEIKVYELEEGLQLLKRYNKNGGVGKPFNDSCKDTRVWKCSDGVIELVANTLLANAVLHDFLIDSDTILPDLIAEWAAMQKPEDGVDASPVSLGIIRKLVLSAGSSQCIYPFCSFLIENCGACKERYLNVLAECLIRAINQNMNEIEYYRVQRDYENLKTTYEQLSQGFVLISKLFNDQKNIYRECLLTSFSLTPSRASLQELETFIDKSFSEEHSPPIVVKNEQNTFDSPDNSAVSNQNVPSCTETETVVADDHSTPRTEQHVDNSNIPLNSDGIDNHDVPCSPKNVHNGDTCDSAKLFDTHDTLPSPERVQSHDILPIPNGVDNHDTCDSSKLIDDHDILPSPANTAENTQSAPSSPKHTVKFEVSETIIKTEHIEVEEKPIIKAELDSAPLSNGPESAVPPNETETRVVSTTGGILSLATDTKLKSDGAVEELVKGAAPGYCTEVENLKLEESMKMDLSSILRYQRFRSLSWELEWSELKTNCENVLEVFEARGFEDVELKFLDIDYSQFKDKPINEDDYIGIEKGYEHFVEPEPLSEESDHGQLSSADSDYDYGLKRRKKIIRRNKLKKVKPKFKTFYPEFTEEFNGAGNVYFIKKKRKLSVDSADGEFKMRKKKVKRPKMFNETADVAIDSQSENHPPDYYLDHAVDEAQSANNLQLLRQFRIGTKTSSGGELSEIACNDAKLNRANQMKPVIIIPKCDDETEADTEKLIRPRISVTLPVPGKRSTIQMKPVRFRRSSSTDSLNDFSANLKVEINKCDSAGRTLNNEEDAFASTPLDDELRSMMALFDPSHTESANPPSPTVPVKSEPEPVEDRHPDVKTEPTEEAKTDVTMTFLQVKPLVINLAKMKAGFENTKVKKSRGRPKKQSMDDSETNPPAGSRKPVPRSTAALPSSTLLCSAAPSRTDPAISLCSTASDLQPAQPTPISFDDCAPSQAAVYHANGLGSDSTENTSESWDQNHALETTSSAFDAVSSAAIPPTYSQTSAVNSVQTSCSVYAPLDATSSDGIVPSFDHLKSRVKSPAGVDSNTISSAASLPASNYTRGEVFSLKHPSLHVVLSNDTTHAFGHSQTEDLSTANASECEPSLFANFNADASSSTVNVNAQQTTSPVYTNTAASSSPADVSDFSQTSTAIQDVASPMSQQPSLQISSDKSTHAVLGTCSELVHEFPANSLDGVKQEPQDIALPDKSSVPLSHPADGQPIDATATAIEKRGRKRKNENAMPDSQPVKIKRQRKPKKDTTTFEYPSFTDGDQSPIEKQPVKIKRPRPPKKRKTLDHQSSVSSIPVMSSPASPIFCSSSTLGVQPPASAEDSPDRQLSTILAVSDVNYQPSVVLPVAFQSPITLVKKPRKPKSGAQRRKSKEEEIVLSDHQPSVVSATEDDLPPRLVSEPCTDANRVTSSVFAAENSNPQPTFTPSVAGSNTAAHSVHPAPDALVDREAADGNVKIKRPRKPKNNFTLSDSQSWSQSSSAYSDSDPDYHPSSDISLVRQRAAVQNEKIKRPRKPKPASAPSDSRQSSEKRSRGRPRKPKPETALLDYQPSPSAPVSAMPSANCNQPPPLPMSTASVSFVEQYHIAISNFPPSSAHSNDDESSALVLRADHLSQSSNKVKRPRKPKKNSLIDDQFVTSFEEFDGSLNKTEEDTVIEVDHQLSPISARTPSYLEVDHQASAVRDSKSRAATPLENGVVKSAPQNSEIAAVPMINSAATTDARYPVVLIPELKLPSANAPTNSSVVNSAAVRRAAGTPKKKETDSSTTAKMISNGHTRYSLPAVEVRVPSIPLSHFQQYEIKQENGAAAAATLPRATGPNHCTPRSSTSAAAAAVPIRPVVVVNGVKNARKPEAPVSSDEELTSTIVSVESTCVEVPLPADDDVEVQRTPKFRLPSRNYLKSYLSGGSAAAPFINASTPKTLAQGYSVIAVPDLNSLPDLRNSPPQVQLSNQDQFANHSHQQLQQQHCAPGYDHRAGIANGNTVSPQRERVSDHRSFASSHNYSSSPMNESTVSIANIKVEYDVDDIDNASPSLCISIPEDAACPDSFLKMRNYLPLI